MELERATVKILAEKGYVAVASKRSLGPADVIAVKAIEDWPYVYFIQCKSNGYLPPAERVRLLQLANSVAADAWVASWHKDGSKARVVRFKDLEGNEVQP